METASYVIVGSGVFGASTALHLSRSFHQAKITLVDRRNPNKASASSDLNKVVRADYDDPVYMQLGLEAQESWRRDPLFQPWYHESGLLMAEPNGLGRRAYESFRKLGYSTHGEMVSPAEIARRFPMFRDANWEGVSDDCFYNDKSGWAEADEAFAALVQAVVGQGVEFKVGTVRRLEITDAQECRGVLVEDDIGNAEVLAADTTILCAGAYTAQLLADSAPDWAELQAEQRVMAVGAVQCKVSYPDEEAEKLKGAPFFFLGFPHTDGEVLPAHKGFLKFYSDKSFTNLTYHNGLKKEISVPPPRLSQMTFGEDVPESLKKDVQRVVENTYGKNIRGLKIESYRMCWDAMSPNQDWIIDYHPKCKNLFVGTAGSFHAWKFMPNIGKYMVQRLTGTLSKELALKWAWDRETTGTAACSHFIPKQDLKDL